MSIVRGDGVGQSLTGSGIKVSGQKLADQRILIYGAGSAGMGIADQIKDGLMILEGLDKDEAARRFWCVDRNGLLVESMGNGLRHAQMAYARPDAEVADWPRENPEQSALRLLDGGFERTWCNCMLMSSRSGCQADRLDRYFYPYAGVQRGDYP